jgi:hypothetical protein
VSGAVCAGSLVVTGIEREGERGRARGERAREKRARPLTSALQWVYTPGTDFSRIYARVFG